jgi:hypothetical protein
MQISLKKQASEIRYRRLLDLCQQLKDELDALEKEGHKISGEIRKAIDKEKMEQILKNIKNPD